MPIAESRLRQLRDLLSRASIEGSSGVHFYLQELIGEGGQGWVYRAAYDEPDGPWVVVKLLRPDVVNEEAISRFLREADVLRKLGAAQAPCPSVVRFYDHGIFRYSMPDGEIYALPFTVLEHVPGTTLAQLLAHAGGKGLGVGRVRRMFRQVARALSMIHAAQIVHRDLKPSNLLVANDGGQEVVKISDFGLVKRFDVDIKGTLALAGASIGYAPPEQFEMGNKRVSARTDVFAFAVVLYEALTGRAAFPLVASESPFQVLSRVLSGPRPRLADSLDTVSSELVERPDLVAAIDREIERATRADPSERHESVQSFWEAVEPLLRAATERGSASGTAKMPAKPAPSPRPARHDDAAPTAIPPSATAVGHTAGSIAPPARLESIAPSRVETPLPAPSVAGLAGVAGMAGVAAALREPPASSSGSAFRAVSMAQLPERARAMALTPDGRSGYALGRFGLRRWEAGGWSQVSLPSGLDASLVVGVLATPAGEAVLYGERGTLWGVLPDGTGRPWAPSDYDVTWTSASISLHPAEIALVGESASQRASAVGLLRPGQPLSRHTVDAGARVCACARLPSGLLLCGESGVLLLLGSGGQAQVPWGRTGHLWAIAPSPEGGAHVVGSGGHALYLTPSGEAKLEPVQTTRDLHTVACSPSGVAWAGGADGRLVRRGPSGWLRMGLPPQATGAVRAMHAGASTLTLLLDDGVVLEGPST